MFSQDLRYTKFTDCASQKADLSRIQSTQNVRMYPFTVRTSDQRMEYKKTAKGYYREYRQLSA